MVERRWQCQPQLTVRRPALNLADRQTGDWPRSQTDYAKQALEGPSGGSADCPVWSAHA
jgi:hypothetical protein